MYFLGCDTSTLQGEVALFKNDQLIKLESWFRQGSHSDVINMAIQNCLDEANITLKDIDVFCTGIGPGSFTGIRISFNTMKTYSAVFNKPFIGVNSLLNIFIVNKENLQKQNIQKALVIINAFKNMVYAQKFEISEFNNQKTFTTLFEPTVIRVQELNEHIDSDTCLLGDGFLTYQEYLSKQLNFDLLRIPNCNDYCSAQSLVQVALDKWNHSPKKIESFQWNQNFPLYLRASEAEENLNGIKYKSL